jgi:flagellar hook-associated protein 3 FlgL
MSDLRVATNSIQESLIRQLNTNQRNLVELQKQLSTGRRVSMPEDDPIIVGRTIRSQSEKTMLSQYHTNNILAEGIVKSSQLHLDEMRQLADLSLGVVNATGASTSSTEREGFRRQLDEILRQAIDIANARQDGEYLFAGVNYANPPYSVDDGGNSDPSDDVIVYNGSPTDRSDPGFDEAETYIGKNTKLAARLDPAYNEDIQGMLQNLLNLRNAYDDSIAPFDPASVRTIAASIEGSDDRLVIANSDLLTKQMRMAISSRSDSVYFAQLDSSIASEVEADMTDIAVKLKQTELSYQAALASASRIFNLSLLNYIR